MHNKETPHRRLLYLHVFTRAKRWTALYIFNTMSGVMFMYAFCVCYQRVFRRRCRRTMRICHIFWKTHTDIKADGKYLRYFRCLQTVKNSWYFFQLISWLITLTHRPYCVHSARAHIPFFDNAVVVARLTANLIKLQFFNAEDKPRTIKEQTQQHE